MFSGAQIVTTKLVYSNEQQEIFAGQNEDKVAQDLVNMSVLVPRTKAAIVVETEVEKIERKALVQERKYERIVEQQKMIQRMEDLMEKVLHEKSLSKKDEDTLRQKIQTIVDKINKESEKIDGISRHPSSSRRQSDPVETSNTVKPTHEGPFLFWYNQKLN